MKYMWSCLTFIVPVLFIGIVNAGVIDHGLLVTLEAASADEPLPVIIRLCRLPVSESYLHTGTPQRRSRMIKQMKENAEVCRRPLLSFLMGRGVSSGTPLWLINGVAVSATPGVVGELSRLPMVERITLDEVLTAPEHGSGESAMPEWNIGALRAAELWNRGITGEGIVVASMDTGVDVEHPDLQDRWLGGRGGWFDPHNEHGLPYDSNGHGTQIMGVMVGGDASGQFIGIAPGARWIAVKIFNDADETLLSSVHQGFQWLLDPDGDPDTDDMPAVVNNSWGLADNVDECIDEFEEDIAVLRDAGMVIVHSAGNAGPFPSSSISPANYAEGFGVGAINESLAIANFSGRGPSACDGALYPRVVAPGVNITTSDLTLGGILLDSYATVTGTSVAAAHAAGAVALLMSAFPDIDPDELRRAIDHAAADLGDAGPDNTHGYGLIDCMNTYNLLASLPGTTSTSTPTTSLPTSSTSTSTTTIPASWPIAYALLWGQGTHENLRVLRMYRDTVLSRTATGRKYIALLYDNSWELCALLMHDDRLLEQTREAVQAMLPEIESLIFHGGAEVKAPLFSHLLSLARQFEANGSPKLRAAIRMAVDALYEDETRRELRIAIGE